MITVHHLDNSRSQRILWLLEELELEYQIVFHKRHPIGLAPPELKGVHPLGKAPVVELDGQLVAESGAAVELITQRYGGGRLMPEPASADYVRYVELLHYPEGSAAGLLGMLLFSRIFRVDNAGYNGYVASQIELHLDYIDGLGVHPYSRVAADERGSGLLRLPGLYGRLVERGKGHIRLWVTEYGTPDSTQGSEYGEPADERRQARRLQRAYALAARWPFVANLTWYEFRDACADPGTPICRLGLVRPELARKQSALALRDLLAGAEAPQLRTAISLRVARSRRHRVRGTVFAPDLDLTGRRVLVTLVRRARHPERSRARRLRRLKPRLRDGRFRLALGRLRPGRYRITARFPGDARHTPSQKTTVIVVRAAPKRGLRADRR